MPLLLILVAGLAAYVVRDEGGLLTVAIINLVASFWGNGVLANYGRHEAQSAPNYAAVLSMVSTLVAVALIIYGLAT